MTVIIDSIDPAECPDCNGEGGSMYGTSWGACETCRGKGTILVANLDVEGPGR